MGSSTSTLSTAVVGIERERRQVGSDALPFEPICETKKATRTFGPDQRAAEFVIIDDYDGGVPAVAERTFDSLRTQESSTASTACLTSTTPPTSSLANFSSPLSACLISTAPLATSSLSASSLGIGLAPAVHSCVHADRPSDPQVTTHTRARALARMHQSSRDAPLRTQARWMFSSFAPNVMEAHMCSDVPGVQLATAVAPKEGLVVAERAVPLSPLTFPLPRVRPPRQPNQPLPATHV